MQAINESLEHGKKAEAYAEQARQKDDFPDSEMAWIESNLAVAKAITGLALAVLAHDGNVAAQQVAEAGRAGQEEAYQRHLDNLSNCPCAIVPLLPSNPAA